MHEHDRIRSTLISVEHHAFTTKKESLSEALKNIGSHQVMSLQQVHGKDYFIADNATNEKTDEQIKKNDAVLCIGEADAILTRKKNITVGVKSADCVPILLQGEGFVAAIHAGWRSATADILGNVFQFISGQWGIASKDIQAVIGPAICVECFEVGEEVVESFSSFSEMRRSPEIINRGKAKPHFDLKKFVYTRLISLGMKEKKVEQLNQCTKCEPELFHSHRRDQTTERQWAIIKL